MSSLPYDSGTQLGVNSGQSFDNGFHFGGTRRFHPPVWRGVNMTSSEGDAQSPNVRPSIQKLSRTAKRLNTETDRLNKAVELVEAALKPLNLGISSWVQVSIREEGPLWETEEVGYTKVRGKWGVALRTSSGDLNDRDLTDETIWPFVEGPRDLRIRAASLLPLLIDKLHEDAEKAANSVLLQTIKTQQIAEALTVAADEPKGGK